MLVVALGVLAFGTVTYALFVQQQDRQLHHVLRQDLERVAALLAEPRLGAALPESRTEGYVLQLVTEGGRVAASWGLSEPLPLHRQPTRLEVGGRPYLVGATGWGAAGGTIRLGHDIGAALQVRGRLLRTLVAAGALVALAAGALGLVSTGRLLAPLRRVAERTKELDVRDPGAIEIAYAGPQDEVSQLVQALNDALSGIREQKREERMFLTEVAHELAGPLTLVTYHLDAAKDTLDDDHVRAAAGAARELLRTSQDLLVLARGETDRPLEMRVFEACHLVERVAGDYPGVRTEVAFGGEIVGDLERLLQAVRNLIRNAVQATGDPGRVTLAVREDGASCVLEVRDDGPGMSEATAARVFDRLYSKTQGAGVGLSIAKRIVEQHDGTIDVRSELGVGTTFEVRLPTFAARTGEP